VFAEVPSIKSLLGSAIIIAAALFVTWHEHQQARRGARLKAVEDQAAG
jgi:drug/metabolite transporter (DMT)-like permease